MSFHLRYSVPYQCSSKNPKIDYFKWDFISEVLPRLRQRIKSFPFLEEMVSSIIVASHVSIVTLLDFY